MTLQAYKTDVVNQFCKQDHGLLQITKRQAEAIHAAGLPLLLLPSKVLPGGHWIKPTEVPADSNLKNFLASYSYYRCNDSVTGYSIAYYTLEEAYDIWLEGEND